MLFSTPDEKRQGPAIRESLCFVLEVILGFRHITTLLACVILIKSSFLQMLILDQNLLSNDPTLLLFYYPHLRTEHPCQPKNASWIPGQPRIYLPCCPPLWYANGKHWHEAKLVDVDEDNKIKTSDFCSAEIIIIITTMHNTHSDLCDLRCARSVLYPH